MTAARVAEVAALLGDPTRAEMATTLLDGRARTTGELARGASVAVSTASGHLGRLLAGGLLAVEASGRHRYYRLAGPDVAGLLESLQSVAVVGYRPRSGPRTPADLRFARSCYDHLAGTLGVALHDHLVAGGVDGTVLTPQGRSALEALGVDLVASTRSASRRPPVRGCLDWSERRPHLAGAVGAALLSTLLERRWVVRRHVPRALRLTTGGRIALSGAVGPDAAWNPLPV